MNFPQNRYTPPSIYRPNPNIACESIIVISVTIFIGTRNARDTYVAQVFVNQSSLPVCGVFGQGSHISPVNNLI